MQYRRQGGDPGRGAGRPDERCYPIDGDESADNGDLNGTDDGWSTVGSDALLEVAAPSGTDRPTIASGYHAEVDEVMSKVAIVLAPYPEGEVTITTEVVVADTSTRGCANTETLQSESPSCQRIHVSRRRAASTNHPT